MAKNSLPAWHRLRPWGSMQEGEQRTPVGVTRKIRFWNKVDALEKLMRHFGLLEKDPAQSRCRSTESRTPRAGAGGDSNSAIKSGRSMKRRCRSQT